MDLKNKKVLVTGANGFIGRHLVAALVKRGACVVAGVKKAAAGRDLFGDRVEIMKLDLESSGDANINGFDAVFHLAAMTDLKKCFDDPARAFEVNAVGTLKLLQSCVGLKKFIYVSTLGVYGEPEYLPIDEDHPIVPLEPYAASKAAGEAAVIGFCRSHGMAFSIVRFFNVYGQGQNENFVVPRLIRRIGEHPDQKASRSNNGDRKIEIGNSENSRDFIYIDDAVSGLIAAAEHGDDDIYNIGTGTETSIKDLAMAIAKLKKIKISFTFKDDAGSKGVRRSRADVTKARKVLKWKPHISLERGLKKLLSAHGV
jgi:UDP-glucose 4-epimerase